MAVTKNQEYTVTVEGYSGEGAGVARIDGFVVFVSGALRGEVCRVLILKVLKSAAFAKVLEVLVPSPHRIGAGLPVFSALRRLHLPPHGLCRGACPQAPARAG